MKLSLYSFEELVDKQSENKIIISYDYDCLEKFVVKSSSRFSNITIVSADIALWDKDVDIFGDKYTVVDYKKAFSNCEKVIYVCDENDLIYDQIRYNTEISIEVMFIEYFMQYNEERMVHGISLDAEQKKRQIPKKIHYFWVGGNPMPEKYIQCIESWKRFCPDYEIIEWNESNYDITKIKYMKEAYENKKWGFVPDYARLDIIYNNGGIYLDTDVEIVKSFDDLLDCDAFIGFESRYYVNAGSGFGAKKYNNAIKKMMEIYEKESFVNPDGTLNMIASPSYQTAVLKKLGLECNGMYQKLKDIEVFPANYFSPKSFYTGINWQDENTYSIHHYDATWVKGKAHDESIERHEAYKEYMQGKKIPLTVVDNQNGDLVSIIVPVYNVEKYLKKCVESILNQTYKNIEIILVDDGSTDKSSILCDEYADKYDNISCVHKNNGGLVSARKAGVDIAKGKYALCIDSDDYIDEGMVEFLYRKAIEEGSDVVFSNMIVENESDGTKCLMKSSVPIGKYNMSDKSNNLYKQFFVDDAGIGIMHGICGKLIELSLYKKYQLMVPEDIHCGEDAACMYPLLTEASVVSVTGGSFYHYIKRGDSVLNKQYLDYLANWERLYYFLKEHVNIENNTTRKIVEKNLCIFIENRLFYGIRNVFPNSNDIVTSSSVSEGTGKKMWQFPFELIEKGSNIVLWGAGQVGKAYYQQIKNSDYCECVAWIDSKKHDDGLVLSKDEAGNLNFDNVVIAVSNEDMVEQITKTLVAMYGDGVEKKIVWKKPRRYFV